jgi:hypothetical protein
VSVDLRERLRRALGPTRPEAGAESLVRPAPVAESATRTIDVHDLVPGSVVGGPLGECFVAERELTLDHAHGDEPLGGCF